jgi:phosphopantetheinyl transferase (holo-ACP synthase)
MRGARTQHALAWIGNDIVDLDEESRDPLRDEARFCARVFADCEMAYIASAIDPTGASARPRDGRMRRLWTLWAAKEAAYKALQRHRPHAEFIPRDFLVANDLQHVRWQCRQREQPATLRLRVSQGATWVHALCYAPRASERPRVWIARFPDPALPQAGSYAELASQHARRMLCAGAERLRAMPAAGLKVVGGQASGEAPVLLIGEPEPTPYAVSISHHGGWVAVAADARLTGAHSPACAGAGKTAEKTAGETV